MFKQSSSRIFFILFLFLLIILAILIGLFYFSPDDSQKEPDIEVKFYKEDTIIAGQTHDFLFTFRTKGTNEILEPEVTIIWPEDFRLISSDPAPQEQLVEGAFWQFDEFSPDKFERILLKGKFLASQSSNRQFKGTINFKLKGISSIFRKDFTFSLEVNPCLSLTVDLPSFFIYGQENKGEIQVTNLANSQISDLRVSLKSDNFFFSQDKQQTLNFDIPKLEALGKETLEFKGFVPFPLEGEGLSSVSLEIMAGLKEGNQFFPQVKLVRAINCQKESLDAFLEISNSRDSSQVAFWQEDIPLKLLIYNQTSKSYEFAISLKINNPQYLALDKLNSYSWTWKGEEEINSKNWRFEHLSDGLLLLWDKSEIPEIENFRSGQIAQLEFSLPLKDKVASLKEKLEQASLNFVFFLNTPQSNLPIRTNEIEVKLGTDLTLETDIRYFDDENWPIGQGPYPPQVGQCTSLWFFFNLQNSTNALKDVVVKTKLPSQIKWQNDFYVSRGTISFNPNSREVVWSIPELGPFEGGPFSLVEARFLIEICPQKEEDLDILYLDQPIYLQAWDTFTQTSLSQGGLSPQTDR